MERLKPVTTHKMSKPCAILILIDWLPNDTWIGFVIRFQQCTPAKRERESEYVSICMCRCTRSAVQKIIQFFYQDFYNSLSLFLWLTFHHLSILQALHHICISVFNIFSRTWDSFSCNILTPATCIFQHLSQMISELLLPSIHLTHTLRRIGLSFLSMQRTHIDSKSSWQTIQSKPYSLLLTKTFPTIQQYRFVTHNFNIEKYGYTHVNGIEYSRIGRTINRKKRAQQIRRILIRTENERNGRKNIPQSFDYTRNKNTFYSKNQLENLIFHVDICEFPTE